MAGNLMNGLLLLCMFALFLALGELIAWTIHELPGIIEDIREFRKWKRQHTRVFFDH